MTSLFTTHQAFLVWVGLTLMHFLWQGLALAALLAVCLRLMRGRSAQVRYIACGMTLAVMCLCVPLTFCWMSRVYPTGLGAKTVAAFSPARSTGERAGNLAIPLSNNKEAGESADLGQTETMSDEQTEANSETDIRDELVAAGPTPAHAAQARVSAGSRVWWQDRDRRERVMGIGFSIATLLWAAGVFVLGIRLVGGLSVLRRWRQEGEPVGEGLTHTIDRLVTALDIRSSPLIRISQLSIQPLAFGLLLPVVLLPVAAVTQLPPELLEAMIAHELAHIRRHDLWVNLLQRIIETLLFYHPAVWWASGRMRLERELCCDDLAVRATGRRVEYAESLIALARQPQGAGLAALAVGMLGARTTLADRVRRVLQLPTPPERTRTWLAGPLSVVVVLTILAAVMMSPSRPRTSVTAAEVKLTSQPALAVAAAIPSPERMIRLDFKDTQLLKAITQFAEQAGQPILGLDEIDPGSKQKLVNLVIPRALSFDEALTLLDEFLFRQTPGFWIALGEHGLVLHQITEWYRYIPPENWFRSQAEYEKAKLPGWAVAKVHYWPKGDAEIAVNLSLDSIPVNGARAGLSTDAASLDLAGFAYFIDRQLAILAKRDVPGLSKVQARALRTIQPGDWLNIRALDFVERDKESDLSQTVDEKGQIYLPGVGQVNARGETTFVMRNRIIEAAKASGIYRAEASFPAVFVEFAREADSPRPVVPGQAVTAPKATGPKPPVPDAVAVKVANANDARKKHDDEEEARKKEERRRVLEPNSEPLPSQTDWSAYRIQPGDQLNIQRLNSKGGTNAAIPTVDQSGDIQLVEIGKIAAVGLTTSALREKIISQAKARRIYAADAKPEVTVRILQSAADMLKRLKRDEERLLTGMGQRSLTIRSMADGIIAEVLVQSGQRVKKGDLLIRLDDADVKLDLQKAQIAYRQANMDLKFSQDLSTHGAGTVTMKELERVKSAFQLAEIELKRLELRLARTQITSPADGIVRSLSPDGADDLKSMVGKKVSAGDSLLMIQLDTPVTQPSDSSRR